MSGLVRVLLGLVVLSVSAGTARATMLWNSGGGVTAKTCSAGDFFSAVDAGGNFTCSTASGSGDVTAVGDCASGACFDGTSGNSIQFEGSTADAFETTLTATDPTADRTITMPNRTGQMALEKVVNLYDYAVCDGTNEATGIQAAITAACALGPGGTLYVPADTCVYGSTLTLCSGLAIVGSDSTERVAYPTAQPHELSYSGTGTAIDAQSLSGVRLSGLLLRATSASFAGPLVDAGGTGYLYIERVMMTAATQAGAATCALLSLNNATDVSVDGSAFYRCGYAIKGRALSSDFSNVVRLNHNAFYEAEACSVQNIGDAWEFTNNKWQQQGATDNESDLICHGAGICSEGVTFTGNMSVDQPSGPTNGQFIFCGSGVSISGNYIGGNTTQDGVLFDEQCDGCSVQGNWFGFLDEAVKFSGTGSSASNGVIVLGNDYDTVTTKVGGTRPGGSIMQENTGGYIVNETGDIWLNVDTDANSGAGTMVIGSNLTSTNATHQFDFTEAYANFRRGNDLRFYDADDSNYVEATVGTVNITSNKTLTIPDATGTMCVSAAAPLTLNATTGDLTTTADPVSIKGVAVTDTSGVDFVEGTGITITSNTGVSPDTATLAATLGTAIDTSEITDGTIVNADVNASAAILFSKLATTNTDKLLGRDTAGGGAVEEIGLTSPLAFTGASAVQIGDVTDCSANQYVNAVGANLALSCAQPDHGNLAGLADDDHTQYWLLAGRTGSQAAILSTNNNGTVTLANSGGAGSGTGTIYGSGKTGENLLLQPNSANTTTGSVKVDGYLDFWPSIATNASQVNVSGFSPTVTLSDGGGYSLIDSNPTLSIPDSSAIQIFRARGSIDRTGTTGGTLYQYTGFHMGTTFTSSTTGGPLFQDAFFDASVINQVANTATQNTYQPISFLSKPTYKASSGATLTIGQTTGVDINPSWGVGGGGTLTNTTFSAFKLHTPNEIGGTLSLPTYIALDVEDLDTAGVTTPLSLRSVGTTTEMRHAGAARFGATGAVTSGKKLDVQGDVLITGALDVGDAVADPGAASTTTIVDINDTINTPNSTGSLVGFGFDVISAQSESNNIIALDVQPTITQSGTSEVPTFYGLNIAGTTTATTANFPVAALLRHVRTYTSATANATPMTSLITLTNGPVVSNTATSGTTTVGTVESLYHNPTLSLNDTDGATSGVTAMTLTNDIAVEVAGTYTETSGTLTVTNRTGLKYSDVTNTGSNTAITNNVGVDIAALSTATTNIGIRNADTTVYTPCSKTSLTSGFTISPDCTVIEIGTSGNNNYTSSTSTGISAGVAGQILTLINVDSNSNTITMDNTGGTIELAGAADYAMGINDTLTLVYSATRSLWLETARSDN